MKKESEQSLLKEAMEYCEEKIKTHNNKGDILFIRGLLHLKQLKYDKAFDDFVKATWKGIYNNKYGILDYKHIAMICSSAINSANIPIKDKDHFPLINKEIRNCSRYIDSHPNDPEVYFIRGCFFFKIESYRDAWSDYKKAIDIGYHKPQIYLYRGMLNQELKDEEGWMFDCFQYLKLITDPYYIPVNKK